MRQAIFFDIDGTVYSSKIGYITDRVKTSIQKAQEHGYLCFISTGRSYPFVPAEIKQMAMDGYICANGSHIIFNQKDIFIDYINETDIKQFLVQIEGMEYNLEGTEYTCISNDCTNLRRYFLTHKVDKSCFKSVYHLHRELKKVLKTEIWINNEQEEDFVLEKTGAFTVENHRHTSHIELFNPCHTKASGAVRLSDLIGVSLENSYSFGDSDNDIELAKVVGHPVAMNNGNAKIKEVAKDICPSVMNDGVAMYLEEIIRCRD